MLPPDSVDWKAVAAGNAEIYVRQRPGPANSLGHFKFDLPDGDGIYLHDTPKKELFAQDKRNLSHGCVRLEDAQRLARWLLGKDPPAASAPEENILAPAPGADHHQLPRRPQPDAARSAAIAARDGARHACALAGCFAIGAAVRDDPTAAAGS